MIFCSKCFIDPEVIGTIERLNKLGTCDICQSNDVFVYETDTDIDLSDPFDELISVYVPVDTLNGQCRGIGGKLLSEELMDNWEIFNQLSPSQIRQIIISICKNKYVQSPQLFDSPVDIAAKYDEAYLATKSILRTNQWEDFVSDLKFKNRFHTKHINTEVLERFCSFIRKPYKKGEKFYRARIAANGNGFKTTKMGSPPNDITMPGRANSQGIRCLYLADSIKTSIHEVRAGAFDYVSVATFKLKKDIIVANLQSIAKFSPFEDEVEFAQYAINREVLKKINVEMAKPLTLCVRIVVVQEPEIYI